MSQNLEPIQDLPELPVPPNPASDSKQQFITKAEAFTRAQKQFGDQLNSDFVPKVNAITADVNVVVTNLPAIQAASTHAAKAADSATAAAASAATATEQASIATDKAGEAHGSAQAASASEAAAAGSAATATRQASIATDKAEDAARSAAAAQAARDAAEASKTAAKTSETNAAAGAATATQKAADAADSATAAQTAKTAAETARVAAETARDEAQAIVGPTVPPTRKITAGTGLSGGGDLTDDRTLDVKYGTVTGTVCQGNDERLDFAGTVKLYYGELDETGKHPLVNGQVLTKWHICDGTDGTPDMRDRVPIGASSTTAKGSKGGSATHTHSASVSVEAHAAAAISGSTASGGSVSASGNTGSATPSISVSVNKATAGGTVGATTLTTNQMPSHVHRIDASTDYSVATTANQSSVSRYSSGSNTYPTGGGQSHTHGFTGAAHVHTVSTSGGAHTHGISISGGNHSHSAGTLETPELTHTASGSVAEETVLPPYVALHFIIFI